MEIAITDYEPWMEGQVCQLFAMNYEVPFEEFRSFFKRFYEDPFQKDHCIRLAAVEGETVVGFQSFFFWPVKHGEKEIRTYQSGNSLVHPDHRGKGIFGKLLKRGNVSLEEKGAEMLIGFPVDASLGSFLRIGWNNDFNLQWFVRPLSPLNAAMPKRLGTKYDAALSAPPPVSPEKYGVRSSSDNAFYQWRKQYHGLDYYEIRSQFGDDELLMVIKLSKRAKVLNELVIGEVYCSSEDPRQVAHLAKECFKQIQKQFKGFAFISFAANSKSTSALDQGIIAQGFKKIKKEIYFIHKPFVEGLTLPPAEHWRMYRGDIDTW